MKRWYPKLGSCLACALLWLLAAPAVPGAAPPKAGAARAGVRCSNESGEMRCEREVQPAVLESRLGEPGGDRVFADPPVSAGPGSPGAEGTADPDRPRPGSAGKPTRPVSEVFFAVRINGTLVADFARLLQAESGRFYASQAQFAAWNLRLPGQGTLEYAGGAYYPLNVHGITYRLDQRQQTLVLAAPADAFAERVHDLNARAAADAVTPQPGVFVNHDVQVSRAEGAFGVAGLAEVGFFSKLGVLTTRLAGHNIGGSSLLSRLDTQFVRDFPGRMATLTIGDSVSASAPWSRQVYYGGVRWASKFSTQPAFVPFVLPTLRGQTARPSTVDIYVDNVRAGRQTVDSGPFAIRNIPVMTGQGELRMVVTDILGRQHVITQSYISSRALLRKGVNEYTYEAGIMRSGFGINSAGYRSLFLSGTQRRGITDSLTLDWRTEVTGGQQAGGIGAEYALLPLGQVGGGVAFSHAPGGAGLLLHAHLLHRTRGYGYSAAVQATTREFSQMGLLAGERPARLVMHGEVNRAIGNKGSISLGLLRQEGRGGAPQARTYLSQYTYNSLTASASFRVARGAFLAVSVNYSPGLRQGTAAAVSLILPLSPRHSVVSTSDLQQGRVSSTFDVAQQLPTGNGYGYRVRSTVGDSRTTEAGLWRQGDRGNYSFEAARFGSDTTWRLGERGSLVWIGRHVARARWLDDSFGLVEVPASKGVRVFANNQWIATTGGRGVAVIPRLVPYERNLVSLDDAGVPIEIGMDFSEKTVIPMPRSGVLLKFAAAKIEGALLVLVTEDQQPVPLGAEVSINDNADNLRVAMRGEMFAPRLDFPARVHVRWAGRECQAHIAAPPGNEPMPRIGPVVCRSR